MQRFLTLCLVAWMGAALHVRAEEDGIWESPNQQMEVVVQTRPDAAGIRQDGYALLVKGVSRPVAFVVATYQRDREMSDQEKAEQRDLVRSAEVYWSPDGKYAIVDEYPMHCAGTIFIMAISSGRVVEFSRFQKDVAWATGVEWVRSRIRVNDAVAWKEGRLQLEIGGTPKAAGAAVNASFSLEADLSGFPDLAFGRAVRKE